MKSLTINNQQLIIITKYCTFDLTVHTTLPVRTASQGVSFAFNTFV